MNFVDAGGSIATAWPDAPAREAAWGGGGLIGALLAEQGDLSAVERFAQFHEDAEGPLQGRYYSSLLPASPPGPGQQLAFEVDLDRCSGCKACVAACHALNGLDDGEAWREVGLLVGGGGAALPVLQHVTSSCHHCLDPACLTACPVDAYEKDPATGIVRHLDDQCIGCQYCTLACPYDAPKFHAGKGIVRKCDMCGDRLRAGEAPACVQACPHEAIRIRVVDVTKVRALAVAGASLPGAIDPAYTHPTTAYRSRRSAFAGELRAADEDRLRPEPAHAPLVVMLVLTQLSVGGFGLELVARLAGAEGGIGSPLFLPTCLGAGLAGIAASLLHLGRPLHAYRAVLGFRHSWLSREVLAFGIFATLATAFVALQVLEPGWLESQPPLRLGLLGAAVAAGLAGLGSSVMVYHVVRRPSWRARAGGVRFTGTALLLGLATAQASLGVSPAGRPGWFLPAIAGALMIVTAAKLRFEAGLVRCDEHEALRHAERLLRGPLWRVAGARRLLGMVGGVALPMLAIFGVVVAEPRMTAIASVLALAALLAGELAERWLFFTAVARPKMPGRLAS